MSEASTDRKNGQAMPKAASQTKQVGNDRHGAISAPVPLEDVVRARHAKASKSARSMRKPDPSKRPVSLRTHIILAIPIVLLAAVITASLTIMPKSRPAAAADVVTVSPEWTAKVKDAWKWRGASNVPSVLVVDVAVNPDDDADGLTVSDVVNSITATQHGVTLNPVTLGSDALPASVAGTQDPDARIGEGDMPASNFSRDSKTVRVAFSLDSSISDVTLTALLPQEGTRQGQVDAFHGDDGLVRAGTLAIRGTLSESYR